MLLAQLRSLTTWCALLVIDLHSGWTWSSACLTFNSVRCHLDARFIVAIAFLGPELLRWISLYVLLVSINGITEGFKNASMTQAQVDRCASLNPSLSRVYFTGSLHWGDMSLAIKLLNWVMDSILNQTIADYVGDVVVSCILKTLMWFQNLESVSGIQSSNSLLQITQIYLI